MRNIKLNHSDLSSFVFFQWQTIGNKPHPYSRETYFVEIYVNHKHILTSKNISKLLLNKINDADDAKKIMTLLYIHGKIRKEDKKVLKLLNSIYFN